MTSLLHRSMDNDLGITEMKKKVVDNMSDRDSSNIHAADIAIFCCRLPLYRQRMGSIMWQNDVILMNKV